ALVFINSPEIRELAETFAGSLNANPVTDVYWRAFSRSPKPDEHSKATAFIADQTTRRNGNHSLALADFCQALMGMNEFIYIE
ncbi:MAG: hypothetical protein ACKVHP_17800, partial [Verrucomicrobiales bacterium]